MSDDWARTAAINALCDQESPDDTAPIESALRQARADALEEAAKVVDEWARCSQTRRLHMGEMTLQEERSVRAALISRASAIRSLKDKQP